MGDENKLPAGAIEGYEGSEQADEDFLACLVGDMSPVDIIEKTVGTARAIEVAHHCFCDDCQEFLEAHGEEIVQVRMIPEQEEGKPA